MSRLKRQQPTRGSRERVRLLVVQHTSPSHDQHPWQLLPVLPNGRRLQRSNNSTGQPGPDELVRPLRPLRHRPSRCLYGVNIQHQEPRSLVRQRRLLRKRSRCKGNHRHSNLPADKLHHIILAIPQHQNTPSSFFLINPHAEQALSLSEITTSLQEYLRAVHMKDETWVIDGDPRCTRTVPTLRLV